MTVITARDVPDAKAYLDGVEVSSLCTAADPDEGWVDLISDGWKADENGQIITERKYGDVRVELPARFTPVRLPVDWGGDSPFGDGDLKEPPAGVLCLDAE